MVKEIEKLENENLINYESLHPFVQEIFLKLC